MRRLSYPLSTIIFIEATFSSVEGVTTPTLKKAPSILSPVYHHTHIDNTFSSIEGGTTPKLKNAPSILSPVYHHTHRDNIFQCRGGYYPNTEKRAVYPIPCLPSYSYRQHIFQYRGGYYPETEKCAVYPIFFSLFHFFAFVYHHYILIETRHFPVSRGLLPQHWKTRRLSYPLSTIIPI